MEIKYCWICKIKTNCLSKVKPPKEGVDLIVRCKS